MYIYICIYIFYNIYIYIVYFMQSCHVCLPSTSIYSGPFPKSTSWWDSWRGCGHHTLMAGSNMWLGPSKKFLGLLYRDSRALHRAL